MCLRESSPSLFPLAVASLPCLSPVVATAAAAGAGAVVFLLISRCRQAILFAVWVLHRRTPENLESGNIIALKDLVEHEMELPLCPAPAKCVGSCTSN